MINSTYQTSDTSSGNEEDVLYQSDALFSAKLDDSQSHSTNKPHTNSTTANNNATKTSNINSNNNNENNNLNDNNNLSFNRANVVSANRPFTTNVHKAASDNKVSSRHVSSTKSNVKSAPSSSKQSSNFVKSDAAIGKSTTVNQNTVHIDGEHKQPRIEFYDRANDWTVNDDMYNERPMEIENDDYVYSLDDTDSGNLE